MLTFRDIDGKNIHEVVALDVNDHQKKFILHTTNLTCFADAHMLNAEGIPATPRAIYADDKVVGFFMYIYDTTDHESFKNEAYYGKKAYFIWHFMIDQRYQGKGYGKKAFEKMLAEIESLPHGDSQYIDLFYHQNNVVAKELYASFGFTETGIVQEHSVHAIRKLESKTMKDISK